MSGYSVYVKPRSSRSGVTVLPDGTLEVRLHAAPTDGQANAELMAVLARHFQVPRRAVRIKSGLKSRRKTIEILEAIP